MHTRLPLDTRDYLRLARPLNGGAGWRLVVGVLAAGVGFVVAGGIAFAVIAAAMAGSGRHLEIDLDEISPALLLANNLGLALCIPLSALLMALVYQLQPRWLVSIAGAVRWDWLRSCLFVAGVVWGALLVFAIVGSAFSADAHVDDQVVAFIATVIVTTPLQAAGEEFLFRGYLLQSLGATRLAAPVCWVVSGAVFAAAHGQFQPPLFADRLLLGVVFAWLATSTGGLEASIALHTFKNVSALIPAAILGELSLAIEPGDVTWAPVALDAFVLAITAPWIRARFRRRQPPRPPLPPPTDGPWSV